MNLHQRIWLGIALILVLACLTGLATAQTPTREATISWDPVTVDVQGQPLVGAVCYRVYSGPRGFTPSGTTRLGACISATTLTVSDLPVGETCFRVAAFTEANREGDKSQEACKEFSQARPAVPTISIR